MTNPQRPICLLLCALGGEGGGVLSDWLIAAARRAGYAAQKTSIPGVAQRTGATTYYVEVFPVPIAQLDGRRPVFSLYPVPGTVDALVSSELLETVRQASLGMANAERTTIVSSSARMLTTAERIPLGDGRYDSAKLIEVLRANSRELHLIDMTRIARQAGTVVSAVMLGAIARTGVLPFGVTDFEAAVSTGGNSSAASLRGFQQAYNELDKVQIGVAPTRPAAAFSTKPAVAVPESVASQFPPAVQAMLTLGYTRVRDYQDHGYARLYVQRLERVLQAERTSDPVTAHDFAITQEMARWLALWMAFDDVVRVADLKLRASRRQRIREEVKANDSDLVRIYDYFRPGTAELAGLLPRPIAQRLLRWEAARKQKGLASLSLPMVLGAHTVIGALALRTLASLRWLRRRGQRYAAEQNFIEQWVKSVRSLTFTHWQCGYEMAQCGRLIKGYGATNDRGKENFLHLLTHLGPSERFASPSAHAQAIADARRAALADDAGAAFDKVLQAQGVPARAPKTAPIHFVKRARFPSL